MNFFRSKKPAETPAAQPASAAPTPANAKTQNAKPKAKTTPATVKSVKPVATKNQSIKDPVAVTKAQQPSSAQKIAMAQPRQNSGVPLPPDVIAEQTAPPNSSDGIGGQGRKRKPRKLGRPTGATAADGVGTPSGNPSALNQEVEALKSKVNQLEGQVEELYNRAGSANLAATKSPRRRGRGRGPPPPESLEELQKLEVELAETQRELAALRLKREAVGTGTPSQRPGGLSRRASVDDDVEEIPRISGPGVESASQGKSVTLTGSYRIPLPSSVSMEDVKSIQSGINSANNIAKGLMESHRSQRSASQRVNTSPSACELRCLVAPCTQAGRS
jgi:hypothetical protein